MVREMGDGDEMPRRTTRVRDGSCVEHCDVELVELDLLSSLDIVNWVFRRFFEYRYP
jgi:hypothetical protein